MYKHTHLACTDTSLTLWHTQVDRLEIATAPHSHPCTNSYTLAHTITHTTSFVSRLSSNWQSLENSVTLTQQSQSTWHKDEYPHPKHSSKQYCWCLQLYHPTLQALQRFVHIKHIYWVQQKYCHTITACINWLVSHPNDFQSLVTGLHWKKCEWSSWTWSKVRVANKVRAATAVGSK